MNVILFGATGMVGQGVLRECLLDPDVDRVLSIGRAETGHHHEKLRQLVHKDFTDFSSIAGELGDFDACFFCLGVSSAGMKEEDYRRITLDVTIAAARAVVAKNPSMVFVYVSGSGTDSTERGRSMWARIKGRTENTLLQMPFRAAYMFRPAIIQPLYGVTSKTKLYRFFYVLATPLFPILRALAPKWVTTTEQIGRAMLHVAKHGAPKRVLESVDITALGT